MSLLDRSQGNARTHTGARQHTLIPGDDVHRPSEQRKYCTSPRHGRVAAAMGWLFPLPALRLELPTDAYSNVPACWWGRGRWIAHCLALYDEHYQLLRRHRMVDSVSRRTFLAYLIVESGGADYRTGRDCRITVERLQKAVARSESTIHRCRRLVNKLGCRTVVFAGRLRTREERLASWKRRDRARGWAAVSALHETTVLPVDNEHVKTLLHQGFGTPPERSDGFDFLSRPPKTSPPQPMMKRRAPRGTDRRGPRAYDQRALLLAEKCCKDERIPLWARQMPRGQLAAALTRYAVAGWQVDDVFGAFEEFRISGKHIIGTPNKPIGYLCHVLRQIPVDVPPALLDRAREVDLEEKRRARQRELREEIRAAKMAAAGEHSPGREAARQATAALRARTVGSDRARARHADDEVRAAARRARGES
ncbi:hypothetical protein [Nocardia tengchongensis]|uniref:hypothetical protein n=1 Tax=Nocardia tengchongensis TaxID=2055889 RepID=UPI003685D23B